MATTTPTPTPSSNPIPPTSHILRTHTLAQETITRHDPITQKNKIFDHKNLSLLARFVCAPFTKDAILRELDMVDAEGDKPDEGF